MNSQSNKLSNSVKKISTREIKKIGKPPIKSNGKIYSPAGPTKITYVNRMKTSYSHTNLNSPNREESQKVEFYSEGKLRSSSTHLSPKAQESQNSSKNIVITEYYSMGKSATIEFSDKATNRRNITNYIPITDNSNSKETYNLPKINKGRQNNLSTRQTNRIINDLRGNIPLTKWTDKILEIKKSNRNTIEQDIICTQLYKTIKSSPYTQSVSNFYRSLPPNEKLKRRKEDLVNETEIPKWNLPSNVEENKVKNNANILNDQKTELDIIKKKENLENKDETANISWNTVNQEEAKDNNPLLIKIKEKLNSTKATSFRNSRNCFLSNSKIKTCPPSIKDNVRCCLEEMKTPLNILNLNIGESKKTNMNLDVVGDTKPPSIKINHQIFEIFTFSFNDDHKIDIKNYEKHLQ